MSEQHLRKQLATQAEKILQASPLIPVITIHDLETAVPLAQALVAGGIQVLEVTLRTRQGLDAISRMRDALPDVWVGAGTVLSQAQYYEAEAAGAQFVITPGSTRELLECGLEAKVPLLPGIATISELMTGYALGYRTFKFFPAEVAGGTAALKAFAGPLPDVSFCPTGGVRPETAREYLALPNVSAVGGTWLTPARLIEQGGWAGIQRLVQDSLELCRGG